MALAGGVGLHAGGGGGDSSPALAPARPRTAAQLRAHNLSAQLNAATAGGTGMAVGSAAVGSTSAYAHRDLTGGAGSSSSAAAIAAFGATPSNGSHAHSSHAHLTLSRVNSAGTSSTHSTHSSAGSSGSSSSSSGKPIGGIGVSVGGMSVLSRVAFWRSALGTRLACALVLLSWLLWEAAIGSAEAADALYDASGGGGGAGDAYGSADGATPDGSGDVVGGAAGTGAGAAALSVADELAHVHRLTLPIYRGVGCMLLLWWCYGLNLWVWSRYRIAFGAILELDMRAHAHMPYTTVWEHCATATCFYELNLMCFWKVARGDWRAPIFWLPLPLGAYPAALFVAFVAGVCWHLRGSVWLRAARQVVCAPFAEVTFLTAYVGDIFTSLIKVFIDLAYALCFTCSLTWLSLAVPGTTAATAAASAPDTASGASASGAGAVAADVLSSSAGLAGAAVLDCAHSAAFRSVVVPLLTALPLWWRFMQCLRRYRDTGARFPHLANALKYALSHSVLIFGVFNPHLKAPLPLTALTEAEAAAELAAAANDASAIVSPYQVIWVVFMVGSTLYTFSWDVTMDWDLGYAIGLDLCGTATGASGSSGSSSADKHQSAFAGLLGTGVLPGGAVASADTACQHFGLRERLMFRRPALYWLAIALDLVLRFTWSLTLIPRGSESPVPEALITYLEPALAAVEIARRCMWGCLRLENEHLHLTRTHKLDANAALAAANAALAAGSLSPDASPAVGAALTSVVTDNGGSSGSGVVTPTSAALAAAAADGGSGDARGWQVVFEVTVLAVVVLAVGGVAALTSRPAIE